MARLTEEEAAQLKALQEKSEAPEEEENGGGGGLSRVLNISVDLGDEAQVERAYELGLLTRAEAEAAEEEDEPEEEGPRRRGFFPEDKQ